FFFFFYTKQLGLGNVDNLFESSNTRDSPNYFCFFARALETQQLKQQNGLPNGKQENNHSTEESHPDPQKVKSNYLRNVLKDTIFIQEYRRTIYPANVTLWNWFEFTCLPILVYEPIYPRMPSIRPAYLLEKILSVIFILISIWSILEKYIYPILSQSEKMSVYESILMLTFPVTMLEILLFFLIFDCILNAIAEITRFADRQFYLDWWNSTSFIEFSRKWNRPVHEFLLRHVYLESMNSYKFGKNLATAGTFIFSVALHEVVLCACLHRFRPWLAALSLFQLPLIVKAILPFILFLFLIDQLTNFAFFFFSTCQSQLCPLQSSVEKV
ncbi:sterol O-acyltransferase, partial [Reticulomyxa filosa]